MIIWLQLYAALARMNSGFMHSNLLLGAYLCALSKLPHIKVDADGGMAQQLRKAPITAAAVDAVRNEPTLTSTCITTKPLRAQRGCLVTGRLKPGGTRVLVHKL